MIDNEKMTYVVLIKNGDRTTIRREVTCEGRRQHETSQAFWTKDLCLRRVGFEYITLSDIYEELHRKRVMGEFRFLVYLLNNHPDRVNLFQGSGNFLELSPGEANLVRLPSLVLYRNSHLRIHMDL